MSIRVLIVDDSVVIRGGLSRILSREGDIRVVGSARNGREALERIERLQPDVVVLDIEMPEMDGLEVLKVLREQQSPAQVLVFSSHTRRGAEVTIEALSLWAQDYVLKPSALDGVDVDAASAEIVRKIRAIGKAKGHQSSSGSRSGRPASVSRSEPRAMPRIRPGTWRGAEAVAIAASTGGPKALNTLLSAFALPLPVPVFIVQHMPPMFTAQLALGLSRCTEMEVCEATDGQDVMPGWVYVAPGGYHMGIAERAGGAIQIHIHQGPPEHQCRPAADVLFRDVANVYGSRALGVVLTGMGQDGLAGSRAIVEARGMVVAQDRASSVVWGMPGFVARRGLATAVLSLPELASFIASEVRVSGEAGGHLRRERRD